MQRHALILFGFLFAVLFVGTGIAVGIGSSSPELPPGAIAVIEDAPPGQGTITKAAFDQEMVQQASLRGLDSVPRPGNPKYGELRVEAVSGLIFAVWLQGTGEEMGIKISDNQIAAALREGEKRSLLRKEHFTPKTMNDSVRKELLVTTIQESIEETVRRQSDPGIGEKLLGVEQQEAFQEFDAGIKEVWQPRTHCADGFVSEHCANYPRFSRSYSTPSACYEADPKAPPQECPAPVPQAVPALPGSVNELAPRGKQLAQRPFPEAE